MDNLELWNKVAVTNPNTTKNFKGKGGFQGTAVCAQSQRKKATEIFGIYGIGWGVTEEMFDLIELDGKDCHYTKIAYRAVLYFTWKGEKGSFPIAAEIDAFSYIKSYDAWVMGNDLYKKVRTDAMTKGLSELGFNADIFEGKFDDNKYVQDLKKEQLPPFDKIEAIKITDKLLSDLKAPEEYISNVQKEYSNCKTQADFTTIQNTIKGDSKNE